jgi:hypothetical protein
MQYEILLHRARRRGARFVFVIQRTRSALLQPLLTLVSNKLSTVIRYPPSFQFSVITLN